MKATRLLRWITPLAVFAALVVVLSVRDSGEANGEAPPSAATAELPADAIEGPTGESIATLRAALEREPDNAAGLASLGDAYYQRSRESPKAAYTKLATTAYEEALAIEPDNLSALTGQATMALIAHDFPRGLELAQRAHRSEPDLAAPYLPLIDGLIETGRYEPARKEIEALLSLKPSLPAYARASYFAELNGAREDALRAMRLARDSALGGTESKAFGDKLVGDLQFEGGDYDAARDSYRAALANFDSYVPAEAGLLNVAATQGELDRAISGYRELVEERNLSEYADELGRLELAAGMDARAERHFQILSDLHERELRRGQRPDAGQVLFEADFGSVEKGLELGERVWDASPSVSSADAYSWALYAAGEHARASRISEEAMKLGTEKPQFLYHAGMIAAAAGRDAQARRLLGRLLERSPRFDPTYAADAKRELRGLRRGDA